MFLKRGDVLAAPVRAAETDPSKTTPKKRRGRKKRERWYADIEASDKNRRWDGATLLICQREDGEEVVFEGKTCLAKYVSFMEKHPAIYFWHYGGGYDIPLLLNYWRAEKIVVTGSNILSADGRHGLSHRDTYPLWLCPLAKMGEAVGLPKLDIDRAQMERLSPEMLKIYCRRDVEIPRHGMINCREFLTNWGVDPDRVSTAGTAATRLMQRIEPLSYQILNANRIPTQTICEMLDATGNPGAMTACYALGHRSNVHCYDIKSSYPSRYATRDVPIGLRRAERNELAHAETFKGIARVSYFWPYRRRVPVAYDNLSGAGYGWINAWLVDDEIQILLSLGIRPQLHEGWCGTDYAPIGQDFARELFAAKERKDRFAFFCKVFVNSWHGKTGMNPVRDAYEARYPRKFWTPAGEPKLVPPDTGWLWHFFTLACDKDGLGKWFFQPMISAIVLGRARAALWKINDAFQQAGWQVFYNDTDSIFSDCPPEKSPIALSNDLGALAFEGGPYEGVFLGAKAYLLMDKNGNVAKCALKGVPHRSYSDAVWEGAVLREARGDERVIGSHDSPFARKGIGRDQRIALFERALSGSAKAYKEGLRTFKKGLRDMDWCRDSLTREIKPTITNLAFDTEGWRLLSADEITYEPYTASRFVHA